MSEIKSMDGCKAYYIEDACMCQDCAKGDTAYEPVLAENERLKSKCDKLKKLARECLNLAESPDISDHYRITQIKNELKEILEGR